MPSVGYGACAEGHELRLARARRAAGWPGDSQQTSRCVGVGLTPRIRLACESEARAIAPPAMKSWKGNGAQEAPRIPASRKVC